MTRRSLTLAALSLILWAPALAQPGAPASAPASKAAPASQAAPASAAAAKPRVRLFTASGKPHPATMNSKMRLQQLDPKLYETLRQRQGAGPAGQPAARMKLDGLMLRPEVMQSLQRAQQLKGVDPAQATVSQWIGIVQRALKAAKAGQAQ